jgi:hypothetical protein
VRGTHPTGCGRGRRAGGLLVLGLAIAAPAAVTSAADAQAATASYAPVADAHTSASAPRANFGAARSLRVGGRARRVAYLRFRPGRPRAAITRAVLRLYALGPHERGFRVRRARDTGWRERGLRHGRRPRVRGAAIARSGAVRRRGWVALDVTRALRRPGPVNLALVARSRAGLRLASREAGRRRAPRLVVSTAAPGGAPPDVRPNPVVGAPFERRPYSPDSPWNTPIGPNPALNPLSAQAVGLIGGPITSDPGQYTYPVYFVDASTPVGAVRLSGSYSNALTDAVLAQSSDTTVAVPLRDEFSPAGGGDAQIIVVNPSTGDEWGFWKLRRSTTGQWTATNGYHYNVYWDGHPPRTASGSAFGARGAGVPYFAGLVRPHEIKRGHIDHALAFAFDYPSDTWVFPAAKSDGNSSDPCSLPEGARLQLDPAVGDAELRARGCGPAAVVIAHALQEYGMYVVDNGGSDKIMLEYSGTADWAALGVDRKTAGCLPVERLRWVG